MSEARRGQFLVVDGIDGAGKSHAIASLAEYCESAGESVLLTREPGGTPLAERIRELIVAPGDEVPGNTTEALLMFSARHLHLNHRVLPALEAGQTVICDRFSDSTYAYQGAGRGLPAEHIAALEEVAVGTFRPDLVLILDLPPAVARQRAANRGGQDRFDLEDDAFMARVRDCYLARAASAPDRYRVVDADQDLQGVQSAVIAALEDWRHHG